jgi:hypothetical protein
MRICYFQKRIYYFSNSFISAHKNTILLYAVSKKKKKTFIDLSSESVKNLIICGADKRKVTQ